MPGPSSGNRTFPTARQASVWNKMPLSAHGDKRNVVPLRLQCLYGLQDGRVFYLRGDDVALVTQATGHAEEGEVVCLRPATGKDCFLRHYAQGLHDTAAGPFQSLSCLPAKGVYLGGTAPSLLEEGHHLF